jgi:hypothetical protein
MKGKLRVNEGSLQLNGKGEGKERERGHASI